jgi:rhodanese-related sulfurtransferase
VEDITAEELHRLLDDKSEVLVLIDVRTPEERQVLKLPSYIARLWISMESIG